MALALDIVAAIAERLSEYAGLQLRDWVLDARATARMARLDLSPQQYVARLRGPRGEDELEALIEAVRVGESSLFRSKRQLETLVELAPMLRQRGEVRVWSAGCAGGQEPYTLAIVLSRALPDCRISILGTDVSADALAAARRAAYPRKELNRVPPEYRDAFVKDGDAIRVAPAIARLVELERANLIDGAAPSQCDVVWCCNVMIYFTPEARRRAIDRLVGATAIGGFVFVGPSESLRDVPALETTVGSAGRYYRRRDPTDPYRSAPPPAAPKVTARRVASPRIAAEDRKLAAGASSQGSNATMALDGVPTFDTVAAEISRWLAVPGLESLTIDLDGAELLDDALAVVFRRALHAALVDGIELHVDATRPAHTRWLARHQLDDNARTGLRDLVTPVRKR